MTERTPSKSGCLAATVLLALSCTTTEPRSSSSVELSLLAPSLPISSLLVGNNVWYDPGDDVWDLSQAAGVSLYRIGGQAYDAKMPQPRKLLEWVLMAQDRGAEVLLQASQYGTPEQAAELVRYFNVEKHGNRPVLFWSIGNEPWLQSGRPPVSQMAARIEAYFKPIAAAMKAVDPSIRIFGVDECEYLDEEYDALFGGPNDITGKVPGQEYYYCDGLSFHRYPQGSGDPAIEGSADLGVRILKAAAKAQEVNANTHRSGKDAFGWALTEYNSKGGSEVHTFSNGQMFATVLGLSMQYGAVFTNTWSMSEGGGLRGSTDFGFVDGVGNFPRASYWHLQFVASKLRGIFAQGLSDSEDLVVYGARDASRLSVILLNRSERPHRYRLDLTAALSSSPGRVYSDEIPAHATQVFVFAVGAPASWFVEKTLYTAEDFEVLEPPKTAVTFFP